MTPNVMILDNVRNALSGDFFVIWSILVDMGLETAND